MDTKWRNRNEFLQGRDAVHAFLVRKWQRELDYRLVKEVWGCRENRMAIGFAYEWHEDSAQCFRSYGNENWEFDEHGLMRVRHADWNRTTGSPSTMSVRAPEKSESRMAAASTV